jgi:tRNA threonylcarbamoyladenosine biosynthesis protein TsaB
VRCHNTLRKATKEKGTALFVLGIDTATPVTSVAVGSRAGALAVHSVRNDRAHAELLVPMVRQALEGAGVDGGELGGIAVGTGPGLFTGLRVGVSSAKALAQAWGRPMVAVSSLDLLAHGCRHAGRLVCAAIDGRRGELFTALYRPVPGGVERLGEYRVVVPAELAAELRSLGEPVLLCGDGAERYAEVFAEAGGPVELAGPDFASPSVGALVQLALARLERGAASEPFEVSPIYLRRPDVDPGIERKLAAERAAAGGDGPGRNGAAVVGA